MLSTSSYLAVVGSREAAYASTTALHASPVVWVEVVSQHPDPLVARACVTIPQINIYTYDPRAHVSLEVLCINEGVWEEERGGGLTEPGREGVEALTNVEPMHQCIQQVGGSQNHFFFEG